MTDRITCVHEAAHACVAIVRGWDVRLVQVHRPGTRADGSAGRCEVASWRTEVNTDPVGVLCFLLSGAAAERRLTGRTSPRDAHDREIAALLAASICERDDPHDPRVRSLLASVETLARALMYDETIWRAVERVAAALQRQGVLSGRDVQLHLREARR